MQGHKICFYGEIWLIIPKLSLLPLLIWSTVTADLCKTDSHSCGMFGRANSHLLSKYSIALLVKTSIMMSLNKVTNP